MENKFCPNCGALISDDAQFCPSCGCEIQTAVVTKSKTPDLPQREIKTVGDMEAYLQELSEYANDSAEAALRAQIQVIRYVQSPKLYDSSFDMLFKNLKDAIKYADSPKMQDMIRERATIMIQNYVFFMEAKLQFEVETNRAEAQGLMEDAIKMLAESTADVAMIAVSGGSAGKVAFKTAIVKSTAKMIQTKDTKGDSFFTKVYRWWTKKSRTAEKQGEFLQTIDTLTSKFSKHRDLIGKSDLIAGIVRRYAEDMTEYFYGDKLKTAQSYFNYTYDNAMEKEKKNFWIILSINILVLLFRWIFKSDENYVADTTHWALQQCGYAVALFAFISIIIFIQYLINRNKAKAALTVAQKEYDDAYQNYLNIAAKFEE